MRYKIGDRVVLRNDLDKGEYVEPIYWLKTFDKWTKNGVVISSVDASDGTYEVADTGYWIAEGMIDHNASEQLMWEDTVDSLFDTLIDAHEPTDDVTSMWEGPFEAEGVSDDSLSLTIHIRGAKAYHDKLEELHRHIETVEHTIEQLNEMDMTIEVED